MKKMFRMVLFFFGMIAMVLLHILWTSLLPLPWRSINILFVLLLVYMIRQETGNVVWLTFVTHLCLELYATTPFGVILFSATTSILLSFWLFQYVLTNRSWYSACALSLFALLLYRALYTGLLLLSVIRLGHARPPWGFLFYAYGWEILLTALMTSAISILIAPRQKNKKLFSI